MNKQFTADDIRQAKEIYYYNNHVLFIVDANNEAYGYYPGCRGWYHKGNFWDYFESDVMMSYFSDITHEEAAKIYEKWLRDDTLN